MATFTADTTLKYKTTKDADMENVTFKKGTEVTKVHEWEQFVLVKDSDGHYFNVKKDKVSG